MLVPNERGLDRALELGCRHIAIFGSATETFAAKNLNSTLDGQFAMFEPTVRRARDAGVDVRAYVSMCFGDPWEGAVPVEQVVAVGKRLFDLGASQLSIGDTIGVGTAGHVTALVDAFAAAGLGTDHLAMHFHDTYGQALANTLAALRAGITTFDASAGGLGGCPYAKSATGNLATEDLVWILTGLGIEHGVDLDALVATSTWLAGHLGRPSPSAVVRARSLVEEAPSGPSRDLRERTASVTGSRDGRCATSSTGGGPATIGGMSRVVHLHIGAPKTGTTYLQHRLSRNVAHARQARRPHPHQEPAGLAGAVPVPRGARPARPGLGRPARSRRRRVAPAGAPAAQQVRHQHRQPRDPRARPSPDVIAKAMRDLEGCEVHVVYSARDLGPRAARGLAGEHQAGPQVGLPAVPQPRRVRQAVVLPCLRPADAC